MPDLIRLTVRAVDLALAPTRFAIRTVGQLVGLGRDGAASAPPPAPSEPRPEPPQTRPREAPRAPSPKAARRAARGEPTPGQAAALRESAREAEWGPGPGPGANVVVDEQVTRLTQP